MANIIDDYDLEQATDFLNKSVGAVLAVDGEKDSYRALMRRGIFERFIDEEGTYHTLIEKLWFHFDKSSDAVVQDYHVFIPNAGAFEGKYSKRVRVKFEGRQHMIQMTVYPIETDKNYIFVLDELDLGMYLDEKLTNNKVQTLENSLLFSMYIDLAHDTTSNISISEISDEVIHQQISYSQWRSKIKNMFKGEDKDKFIERSSPEYLKEHFAPGQTISYDCEMMNLEGKFIWVKLTFSRTETNNPSDYRFVYMLQNIHETLQNLKETAEKYEEMASKDTLTGAFNHGRIETEINNAIQHRIQKGENVSLMILDIDFFKHVNDEYGHHVGDVTLIHFVETIAAYDWKRTAVVGRWGGEEFVVVVYGADRAEIEALAEEVRKKIETEPFEEVGNITCSIGAVDIKDGDDLSSAFDRMDKALYEAKASGRNRVVLG